MGESFELRFECRDAEDPDRKVTEASYQVRTSDWALVSGGKMSVDETGHIISFRFNPQNEGVLTIVVNWGMGQDRFEDRFMITVKG